eukprot:754178-Hanusia_phi.AAC.6
MVETRSRNNQSVRSSEIQDSRFRDATFKEGTELPLSKNCEPAIGQRPGAGRPGYRRALYRRVVPAGETVPYT